MIEANDFDQIFYIFHRKNSAMQKKLEDKLKVSINEPPDLGRISSISEKQTIVWMPGQIMNAEEKRKANEIIDQIRKLALQENFRKIALCINLKNMRSFLEFKTLLRENFYKLEVSLTIFQDKAIEVSSLEDIKEILNAYHKTLLGGHAGIGRMKNNIRRFYSWPSMTRAYGVM